MSQDNKDIQGSQTVSRHQVVGGNASVGGSMVVGHNLFVKGWLDAPNIKYPCKGLYATEEELKKAHPRPMPGWFALIGDTLPAQIWCVVKGERVWTGKSGGEFNVHLASLEENLQELQEQTEKLKDDLAAETEARENADNNFSEAFGTLLSEVTEIKESTLSNTRQIDQLFEVTADLVADSTKLQTDTKEIGKRLTALENTWVKVADEETAEQMAEEGKMEKGKFYYTVEE